jgi:glycosyltransferase involved in cell wall biosynthesis
MTDSCLLPVHFVIPAHNEAQSIRAVIQRVWTYFPNAHIAVINDCSRDETAAIAADAGATVINLPFNGGYGVALHTGLLWAQRREAPYVITQDADGQHDPKEALKLVEPVASGIADVAIGSRYLPGALQYKVPLSRRLGSWLLAKTLSLLMGKTITDSTTGFQCLNARALATYLALPNFPDKSPDADMLLYAHRSGCRVLEVSTAMYADEGTESMHGLIKSMFYMPKMFVSLLGMLLMRPPVVLAKDQR